MLGKRVRQLVAIDVGTHKMAVAVVALRGDGVWRVLNVYESVSRGVTRGEVTDSARAADSLGEAIAEAEERYTLDDDEPLLGLSGAHLRSQVRRMRLELERPGSAVREADIQHVRDLAEAVTLTPDRSTVVTLDRRWRLDGVVQDSPPVGAPGRVLEGDFLVVDGVAARLRALISRVTEAGLKAPAWTITAAASASAVLTPEQRALGVLLLDCGAGLTHYALYLDGCVEAVGAVPAAGSHATRDIMAAFTLRWQYAERLKREFGTVEAMDQADARVVSLPADKGFPGCRVYASMLALVMRVRWEETFRAVQRQLPPGSEAKYHLVVVTGGSSQTPGLDALARYVFGVPAQAVTHHDLEADDTVRSRPEYSAVLGLAHEAVQRALRSREGGWLDRLLGGQP